MEQFANLKEAKVKVENYLYDNIKNPSELMQYQVDIIDNESVSVHNKLMNFETIIALNETIEDAKCNVDGLIEAVNYEIKFGMDYYDDRIKGENTR